MPVAESTREKTAFVTPFGLYQIRMMPFGLQGAPATFQRMMDKLIRGMEDYTAAYSDDLVIFSDSWERHLHHIREVFDQLRAAGLTAKPRKCQFGMAQCVYLGNGLFCPEPLKIDAVMSFPIYTSDREADMSLSRCYWILPEIYTRLCLCCCSTD